MVCKSNLPSDGKTKSESVGLICEICSFSNVLLKDTATLS